MAAHVPCDEGVLGGKRVDLAAPHLRCGRIDMGEQNYRPATVDLIVNPDPVTRERRHLNLPFFPYFGGHRERRQWPAPPNEGVFTANKAPLVQDGTRADIVR